MLSAVILRNNDEKGNSVYIWYKCKFLVVLRIKPRASSVLDAHLPLNYGPRVMSTFNLWLVELAEMKPEDRGQTLCKKKRSNN